MRKEEITYSVIRESSYKENSCGMGMKQQWSTKIDRDGKKEIGNTSTNESLGSRCFYLF